MKNLLFAIRPLALDMLATLVFVALGAITHNPILATAIAVGAGIAQLAYQKTRGRRISAMQMMSLGLVLVFGGATLLTHDARFMMFKPTVIYILIGASMLQPGWMLPYLPPQARDLVGDAPMVRWGYVWAGLMLLTAVLNAGFALTTSFATWSSFIAIFPLVSKLGLFAIHYISMRAAAMRAHRAREAAAQGDATDLALAA